MTNIIQIKNLSMEINTEEPGVFFSFEDPKNEDDLTKFQFEYMQNFVVKCLKENVTINERILRAAALESYKGELKSHEYIKDNE